MHASVRKEHSLSITRNECGHFERIYIHVPCRPTVVYIDLTELVWLGVLKMYVSNMKLSTRDRNEISI